MPRTLCCAHRGEKCDGLVLTSCWELSTLPELQLGILRVKILSWVETLSRNVLVSTMNMSTWSVVYRSLLLASGPDLGCCGETAESCPTLGLLPPAVLSCGHHWDFQGQPTAYQKWLHQKWPSEGDGQEYGGQAEFSKILLVTAKGLGRRALILYVNSWLQTWCWQQDFGFYDHGTLFEDQWLLRKDKIHLTKHGKGVFASRMADLVRRILS